MLLKTIVSKFSQNKTKGFQRQETTELQNLKQIQHTIEELFLVTLETSLLLQNYLKKFLLK